MKTPLLPLLLSILPLAAIHAEPTPPGGVKQCIPFDQLGAEAQKQYAGDGISIVPTKNGAKLKAVMQDLEAEATAEGLWLTSTADEDAGKPNRFRVCAATITRDPFARGPAFAFRLPPSGVVRATTYAAAFIRPGLIEEYTVSTDGIRQDFVLPKRPPGEGVLSVELHVTGARVEPTTYGARLTVETTGRALAYSRLRVTDATGRELSAEMATIAADRLCLRVKDDLSATYPLRIDPTFSDADWVSMGGLPGANGAIRAMAVDAAGNLYIGGEFTAVGEIFANRVAKWNGSIWTTLGSGIGSSFATVYALAVDGTDVYAGGQFSSAGGSPIQNIAKWTAGNWSALGSGPSGPVYALAKFGSDLYAGGNFQYTGGFPIAGVAKWNGGAWSQVGLGMHNDTPLLGSPIVYAMGTSGTDLYVGGTFTHAGGSNVKNVARWNGSSWFPLGSGIESIWPSPVPAVRALVVSGSTVYAGGNFDKAVGTQTNGLARWTGIFWSYVSQPLGGRVGALALIGTSLYVATEGSAYRIQGTTATSLGIGPVYAFAASGADLFAGGDSLAKWNGSSWSALGPGTNGAVRAFAVSGADLYMAGSFTSVGSIPANRIAKWNGSGWSPLGSGLNGAVNAVAISGTFVYAGGVFTEAGGVSANRVAVWDGSNWAPLGSGITDPTGPTYTSVDALATSGTDLYAGGLFTIAGGIEANYIARWDGNAWSPLGTGLNWQVSAVAASGTEVIAGGIFTMAGGLTGR